MIKVIIKCPVQAGKTPDFIALGNQLASLALQEPGCLSYQLVQSLMDENQVFLVEEWENQEQLGAHLAKPYYGELTGQMVALQDGAPDIDVCRPV